MNNTREAFALRRYSNKQGLFSDLASLAIESATELRESQRVNYFELTKIGLKVVNLDLGESDISNYYAGTTELDRRERTAGLLMREVAFSGDEGDVAVWLSPSGGPLNYQESRIVVGIKKQQTLECYAICTKLSPQELLDFGKLFSQIKSAEDLREVVFVFKNLEEPWEFLQEHFSLPEVWQEIISGQARLHKEEVKAKTKNIVDKLWPYFLKIKTVMQQIVLGSIMEQLIGNEGYVLASGVCGLLNTDIISQASQGVADFLKRYDFVWQCGNCQKRIQDFITKGHKCVCGGVYQGCGPGLFGVK